MQNAFLDTNGFALRSINSMQVLTFFKMFSTIGQSPCDVAAELASVCVGGRTFVNPILCLSFLTKTL